MLQKILASTTFFSLLFMFQLTACNTNSANQGFDAKVRNLSFNIEGQKIAVKLAFTPEDQTRGLSGLKSEQFSETQSMLFFNLKDKWQRFWMPDTYMNLDIFFLDKNFKIVAVERNVAAHPGRDEPPTIARTGEYWARHVLEMRTDSKYAKKINVGDILTLDLSQSEIESYIRQQQ